jgi:hypothetical protein
LRLSSGRDSQLLNCPPLAAPLGRPGLGPPLYASRHAAAGEDPLQVHHSMQGGSYSSQAECPRDQTGSRDAPIEPGHCGRGFLGSRQALTNPERNAPAPTFLIYIFHLLVDLKLAGLQNKGLCKWNVSMQEDQNSNRSVLNLLHIRVIRGAFQTVNSFINISYQQID